MKEIKIIIEWQTSVLHVTFVYTFL